MKHLQKLIIICTIISSIYFIGCATSEESTTKEESTQPAATPPQKPAETASTAPSKADTVNVVNVQTSPKPAYEPAQSTAPAMAKGNYTIQIGAFRQQESADRAAGLAKERLGKDAVIITDKTSNLLKVMVGAFATKEEARSFRDEMVEKFPAEYKDAWVTEINQK